MGYEVNANRIQVMKDFFLEEKINRCYTYSSDYQHEGKREGKRVVLVPTTFLVAVFIGKFFFFCHNFLFDRPSTTSRTSVSLNNELGNWLNNPVHNISNGSILVCLGHELNTIDRTIWDLLRYEITCEQKDFMSYSCGKKVHLFVYTKKECGFPAIGKKKYVQLKWFSS